MVDNLLLARRVGFYRTFDDAKDATGCYATEAMQVDVVAYSHARMDMKSGSFAGLFASMSYLRRCERLVQHLCM